MAQHSYFQAENTVLNLLFNIMEKVPFHCPNRPSQGAVSKAKPSPVAAQGSPTVPTDGLSRATLGPALCSGVPGLEDVQAEVPGQLSCAAGLLLEQSLCSLAPR